MGQANFRGEKKSDVMAQIWTMPACVNLSSSSDDVDSKILVGEQLNYG